MHINHQPKIATVFGGTGFIGRAIVQRLARQGYTVRVPTRHPASAEAESLRVLGNTGQVVPVRITFANPDALLSVINGADVVINLLGILFERKRGDFTRVHIEHAKQIATVARTAGVPRLVHVSALGVNTESLSEYARSKAKGEEAVRAVFPSATILRPSVVFGTGDRFFTLFAEMTGYSPFLPLIGGGSTKFQPVYVGDVADAAMATLALPEKIIAKGETYQLGGPDVLSFKQLMEKLLAVLGRRRLLLSIPWPVAMMKAAILGLFPSPLLTVDQVRLLKQDNIVAPNAKTFADLGIAPASIDACLPSILKRFGVKSP